TIVVNGVTVPVVGPAPADHDPDVYQSDGWVRTPAIALVGQGGNQPTSTAFQIEYRPLANGTDVRVVVTGYDFDLMVRGRDPSDADSYQRPVTRTVMQDFRLIKRVDAAVLSPS